MMPPYKTKETSGKRNDILFRICWT